MNWALWLLPFLFFSCAHHPARHSNIPQHPGANNPEPSDCRPLGKAERARLLAIADPENFPHTHYRKGSPNARRGIERETDCSHFVHEVYRRAGLPYAFRTTGELSNAREFDLLSENEAKPGDLMLFRGHVGIVDNQGRIISAVRTRHRRRKSSIVSINRQNFRSIHGQRYVLRYRCQPIESHAELRTPASENNKGQPGICTQVEETSAGNSAGLTDWALKEPTPTLRCGNAMVERNAMAQGESSE